MLLEVPKVSIVTMIPDEPVFPRYEISDFTLHETIGIGNFGKVMRVKNKETGN